MSIAHWIGARAADVVAFFRDKPFVPCQLPDSFFDSIEEFIDTDEFYEDDQLDDCCPDYEVDCCLTTDTIAEMREWNQRK